MAIFKQGQLNQVLAVCVDKTDFASVESGVTSGFTCTLYTYKQNSSTAVSAVTLSRAPSVVRSGIVRIVMKTTETSGVDNALLKIAHASCADQYIPLSFHAQDISDAISNVDSAVNSQYSDLLSTLGSQFAVTSNYLSNLSSFESNIYSMLSDFYSTTNSQFAVVSNYLSNASNYLSNLSAVLSDVRSNVSDLQSDFQSRVPKAVATASRLLLAESVISDAHSAAAQANSRVLLNQSRVSDVYSMLSDFYSDFQSRVTGALATAAVLSDFYSDFQSRVPKAVATNSQVSDLASDIKSYLLGMSGAISDVDSQLNVTASKVDDMENRISDLESLASDAHSAAAQANSRALVIQSLVSDVDSALTSQYAAGHPLTASDLSDIRSAITAKTFDISASDMSDIRSAVLSLSGMLSDAHSAAEQANSRALVIQSTLSDIDSALTSQFNSISNAVSDAHSDIYSLLGTVATKTNSLTFTVGGQVDANIQYVNDVQIDGVGSSGDPWGPV